MSLTIRPARASDLEAVRDCARAAYGRYVQAIGREPAPMVADFTSQIAAGQVRVACENGALCGFVVYFPRGEAMFLENVAVRPEAAGRGVGRALMADCEAAARRQGADRVLLYTNVKMVENLSLYPHLGFDETGRRHEDGFDRVYFEKRL